MTITLEVTKRSEKGKAVATLRKNGVVPGVMYGHKEDNVSISVDGIAFEKALREAGESSIIVLKGLDEEKEVLIQDVAFDPINGGATHVDFYAIERGKELTVNVLLEFVGDAPATKTGANISRILYDVEVVCLPRDLPHNIEVDISVLAEIGDSIHVKDLNIPENVTVTNSPEDLVISAVEVIEVVEEEEVEDVDMDAVEVEQKGKDEESSEEEESEEKKE